MIFDCYCAIHYNTLKFETASSADRYSREKEIRSVCMRIISHLEGEISHSPTFFFKRLVHVLTLQSSTAHSRLVKKVCDLVRDLFHIEDESFTLVQGYQVVESPIQSFLVTPSLEEEYEEYAKALKTDSDDTLKKISKELVEEKYWLAEALVVEFINKKCLEKADIVIDILRQSPRKIELLSALAFGYYLKGKSTEVTRILNKVQPSCFAENFHAHFSISRSKVEVIDLTEINRLVKSRTLYEETLLSICEVYINRGLLDDAYNVLKSIYDSTIKDKCKYLLAIAFAECGQISKAKELADSIEERNNAKYLYQITAIAAVAIGEVNFISNFANTLSSNTLLGISQLFIEAGEFLKASQVASSIVDQGTRALMISSIVSAAEIRGEKRTANEISLFTPDLIKRSNRS